MNDQDLRALVRAAVERHLGGQAPGRPVPEAYPQPGTRYPIPDASHYVYLTLINAGESCVIEPNVPCNHCNYCKSHGH